MGSAVIVLAVSVLAGVAPFSSLSIQDPGAVVRIGAPLTREIDRKAQDYFTDEVGLTLYLKGSRSPYLTKGSEVLEDMAERYGKTELGAKIAMTPASPCGSCRGPYTLARARCVHSNP